MSWEWVKDALLKKKLYENNECLYYFDGKDVKEAEESRYSQGLLARSEPKELLQLFNVSWSVLPENELCQTLGKIAYTKFSRTQITFDGTIFRVKDLRQYISKTTGNPYWLFDVGEPRAELSGEVHYYDSEHMPTTWTYSRKARLDKAGLVTEILHVKHKSYIQVRVLTKLSIRPMEVEKISTHTIVIEEDTQIDGRLKTFLAELEK